MPILTTPPPGPEPVEPVETPTPDYAMEAARRMSDILASLTGDEWAALPEPVRDAAKALQVALAGMR